MANCMLGFPNNIDACVLSGGSFVSTLPRTNLQVRKLKQVARTTDLQQQNTVFDIDQTKRQNARAIALVNHNMSTAAKYRIRASDRVFENIISNSMMQGVSPGTSGIHPSGWDMVSIPPGCTRTISAVGVEDGLTYLEFRIAGTVSAAGAGCAVYPIGWTVDNVVVGAKRCFSMHVKLQAGAMPSTAYLGIDEVSAVPAMVGGTATAILPNGDALGSQRYMHGRIMSVASVAYARPYLWIPMSNGQTVDMTLRLAAPMFNVGLHAPLHVPTFGTKVSGPDFGAMDFETGLRVTRHYNFPCVVNDFAFSGCTVTTNASTVTVTSTFNDPTVINSEANIDGSQGYILRIRMRRVAGSAWDGSVFYVTENHGFSEVAKCLMPQPAWDANGWGTIVLDLRTYSVGGTSDFATANSVSQVRFDFGASTSDVFEIDYIQFGVPHEYDSGWQDVWPVVYPYGTLQWEDPNWWGGRYSPEEISGYTRTLVHVLDQNYLHRYWRVELEDATNSDGYIQIGRVFIGPVWQPDVNMSYGASISQETDTEVQKARGGAEYFDERTPYRVMKYKFDHISKDAALANAMEIQRRAGISKEVLWVMDPDDTTHAIRTRFLGRLRTLSPIEFPYYNLNSTAFEIKELQ